MFGRNERIRAATDEEEQSAMQQIIGLTVTAADFCAEHGWMLEFDDRIRLQIDRSGEDAWYRRKVV
jgi:hypothetical protein